MNLTKAIVCLLVFGGAVIMAVNIHHFASLMKKKDICSSKETHNLLSYFKLHLVLMVFFLIGYIIVFGAIIFGIKLISELLIGPIFFFGALFVLLGIFLQDKMLDSLRNSYIQAIKMLVSAVEIRDPYTIGHSEHVANLSLLIFDRLSSKVRKNINRNLVENAGLLHDIGKVGVPEEVLNKTGKLNNDEWMMVRQHATIGKSLIGNLDCMDDISTWIEYHHERIDGKGYYQISESEIPLVSRILSAADTYSALATDRPYRKGKTHQEAMDIIIENAGSQLDIKIVDIFRSIDKASIKQCRPASLVIDYLDDLRKIENYAKDPSNGSGIDMVLREDLGILCLQKIFAYCLKQNAYLSLTLLKINGLSKVEKHDGYHKADEISDNYSSILFSNIRRTDFVVKFRRDFFVLAFPQCPNAQALKLINRIQGELENSQTLIRSKSLVSFEKDFFEFQPSDLKSKPQICEFLNKLSFNGLPDLHIEDFISGDAAENSTSQTVC